VEYNAAIFSLVVLCDKLLKLKTNIAKANIRVIFVLNFIGINNLDQVTKKYLLLILFYRKHKILKLRVFVRDIKVV